MARLSDFCRKVFMDKRRTPAVLFLIVEATSFALDQFGGRHLGFLVASVYISLVGFLITTYNFSKSKSEEVENERNVIELVFSIVQWIVTCVYFTAATLGVKLKFIACVFPLVLAITSVALAFKNNEQDLLPTHTPGAPTEEENVYSSLLVHPVTSSNALAAVESTTGSVVATDVEGNTDSKTFIVSSNTRTMPVDEEITSRTMSDDEEIADSLPSRIQGVVDEEENVDSSSLIRNVTLSNALAAVESTTGSVVATDDEENTDSKTPIISSNTPTMPVDEEITSPTMSDDEEIADSLPTSIQGVVDEEENVMSDDEKTTTSPRGWRDVDEGTVWIDDDGTGGTDDDDDEGTGNPDFQSNRSFGLVLSSDMEPERFLSQRQMTSAQSNLRQSTKLFSKYVTISDSEGELPVPSQAMKHFPIPEIGKEFVDLAVKDWKGEIWNFRLTTHPRPALTDGWHEFVGAKELKPGDIVSFYKLKDEIFGEQYRVEVDRARVIS